jgi:hypothetical protein
MPAAIGGGATTVALHEPPLGHDKGKRVPLIHGQRDMFPPLQGQLEFY